ncbi:hypothetical protein KY331_02875 [Candidatus Woesearchaeota archaeon]|nr:hypothetical protein [Candidatus Woesearchaeota archaeon]
MKKIMIVIFLACVIVLAGCGSTGQTVNVAQQEQEGKLVTVKEQSVEVHKPTSPPTTVPPEQNDSQDDVDDTSNEDVPDENDDSTDTDSESSDDPVVSGESEKILILKFKGNPSELEIKLGTTVLWENQDVYGHVIGIFKVIEGPMLRKGETWSYIFNETGNYTWMSMGHPRTNGQIIVTE